MATKALTNEAIAMTEKKINMTLGISGTFAIASEVILSE